MPYLIKFKNYFNELIKAIVQTWSKKNKLILDNCEENILVQCEQNLFESALNRVYNATSKREKSCLIVCFLLL